MIRKNKSNDKIISKSNDKEIIDHKKSLKSHNKKYDKRLIFCMLIFIISYILCVVLINKSFNYQNAKTIKYQDKQAIDYKVYLKKNSFYEQEFLDKDMIYVASLIDTIDINFTYDFLVENDVDLDFDYRIIGNLIISSPTDNNKQYFNKKYVLLDKTTKSIKNTNKAEIKENIKIDYDYYNDLASSFKSQFVVDTDSYLNVYLEINKKTANESEIQINDQSLSSIKIPLSKRSVDIKFDVPDTSDVKDVIINGEFVFNDKIIVIEAIVVLIVIISFIRLIQLIRLRLPKKSKYEKFLKKILKEYDRLIVETTTLFDENSNIIKINDFEELLDVRDNLKLPIMHYDIEKGLRSYFYIKNDNDIYLFDLNSKHLEEKSKSI